MFALRVPITKEVLLLGKELLYVDDMFDSHILWESAKNE